MLSAILMIWTLSKSSQSVQCLPESPIQMRPSAYKMKNNLILGQHRHVPKSELHKVSKPTLVLKH